MELTYLFGPPIILFVFFWTVYLILVSNSVRRNKNGFNSIPDWNFFLKKKWASYSIRRWKKSENFAELCLDSTTEEPLKLENDLCDTVSLYGTKNDGSSLLVTFTRRAHRISEVMLILTTPEGSCFQLPNHPNTIICDGSSDFWQSGGLNLVMLEPFMRWRIIFNGLLSKTDQLSNKNDTKNLHHIRFNFIWTAASNPLRFPDDSSDSLLAEAVALEPWKDPYWMHGITNLSKKGYDQYGNMCGTIKWSDTDESSNIILYGIRSRRWQEGLLNLRRTLTLTDVATDGTMYHIEVESYWNGLSQVKHGNVRTPNGDESVMDDLNIDLSNIGDILDFPKAFTIKFSTKSKTFISYINLNKKEMKYYSGGWQEGWEKYVVPYQGILNGAQSSGYLQLSYPNEKANYSVENQVHCKQLHWLKIEDIDSKIPICTTFKENVARCPQVVGGKFASLALLSSVVTTDYSVPEGFCLTRRALDLQIKHNTELQNAISLIEDVNIEYSESNMKTCCERASNILATTQVCDIVREHVIVSFEKLCDSQGFTDSKDLYMAVRSSGIGEDSEELSAAGQNATILGCKTIDDVLCGIQKCWASLFTFQSVEYRRQHGQEVNCGMGVVIQVMVEARAAGVMFTRHPNNGNPSIILITSNYGLGESVVSGHVEPDTIILEKDIERNINITKVEIGKKNQRIIIDKSDKFFSGTMTIQVDPNESNSVSISEEECLQLGNIAIQQESLWGSARDIEWAIVKGKIYLLQARPITSLNNWTEFELRHELDSPVMSDEDYFTFANTGEVLPGCYSPLAYSTLGKALDKSISLNSNRKWSEYFIESLSYTHQHICLNVFNTMLAMPEKEVTIETKTMDLAIYGHITTNSKINSIAINRSPSNNFIAKMLLMRNMIGHTWKSKKVSQLGTQLAEKFTIDLSSCKSSIEMYDVITKCMPVLTESCTYHGLTSSASIFSQIIFFRILLEGKDDFTTQNYKDIGTVLSSCSDIISADIPKSLKKITQAIQKSGKSVEFCEQTPENSFIWLRKNLPDINKMLSSFLYTHGHRCIKELDLLPEPWGINPTPLMKTLQTSVNMPYNDDMTSYYTAEEIISKLVSPISNTTKKILKLVIPMCQNSVARRETTKSALVLITHKLRMAYHELEKQMIKEWRIPNLKTIFFMTHSEIGKFLHNRDPAILKKANLRRRYYPQWDKLQFPESVWGFPQPINSFVKISGGNSDVKILGTPVCSGDIIGRACVIKDISEIDQLQNGDILITNSTDIGWSPYFPLLGGVVTELGGLISHGAVVAREYGLPCIVGAQGATNIFKTGDTVLLAATSGILEKYNDTASVQS